MPLYDFACHTCDASFEALAEPGGVAPCPGCGSAEVRRVWQAPWMIKSPALRGRAARESDARRAEREARRREGA